VFGWLAVSAPATQAESFDMPPEGEDIVGEIRVVIAESSDTLLDIARKHDLGYNEIMAANPDVDPWLPNEGAYIILPTQFVLPKAPRRGLVLNIPQMRLFYFVAAKGTEPAKVITHPIGIGREYLGTPFGRTSITTKRKNPTWYPPESIRKERAMEQRSLPKFVPPGPNNPLGNYAMNLGMPGYLIHGTNRPWGIGRRVSHGCIRLYPEDIESLFHEVPVGTPVEIVNQPYVAGWRGRQLFLQAFAPLSEHEQASPDLTGAMAVVLEKTNGEGGVDWDKATAVARDKSGIPTPVQSGTPDLQEIITAVIDASIPAENTMPENTMALPPGNEAQ